MRPATLADLSAIRAIYNQGVEDRVATLDPEPKSDSDLHNWWTEHNRPYVVVVATREGEKVVGWASLNRFSHRCAHSEIADLSVYVARDVRGTGVGTELLRTIDALALYFGFHKIVLHALARNVEGKGLYEKAGFRLVGVLEDHGKLDAQYLDVIIMEKILKKPLIVFVCKHNTGRSQMAEAYLRHFAGEALDVRSAGTMAAANPDPGVVAAMAEDGVDISRARPKLLADETTKRADRIITMGCDVRDAARIDDDWGLPDPKGQPIEKIREIRDAIKERARALAAELTRMR